MSDLPSLSEQKAAIRNDILARRNHLDPTQRVEMSLEASAHGEQEIEFSPGTIISAFFPIRSEIDPRPLMDKLQQKGARLCLPVVMDKTTIVFRELVRGEELVDTGFGTKGPGEQAKVVDPSILIMPLSAFDMKGGRIGYGAGHYDRAIEKLINKNLTPELIGFAFSLQEVDHVPVEDHDQPLSAIITETGYHRVRG